MPTTDLVARPQDLFHQGLRAFVISLGRSGNSSESIVSWDLLDRIAPDAGRLNIICNSARTLATRTAKGTGTQRVIVLPDAFHNAGVAMTSSYITMLLTVLASLDDVPVMDAVIRSGTRAAQ